MIQKQGRFRSLTGSQKTCSRRLQRVLFEFERVTFTRRYLARKRAGLTELISVLRETSTQNATLLRKDEELITEKSIFHCRRLARRRLIVQTVKPSSGQGLPLTISSRLFTKCHSFASGLAESHCKVRSGETRLCGLRQTRT